MKFLLDANLPYSAKDVFQEFHTAIHVRDIGLSDAPDEKIISWAKSQKVVLITRDLDFSNILNFPPRRYYGIIVLRLPAFYSASEIKRVLAGFLDKVEIKHIPRSVIIVEEGRYRIRR